MLQSRKWLLLCAAWLLQNACAVTRSKLQPHPVANDDRLLSYWSPLTDPKNQLLVVPHLKLLICAVPKNACTQFKLLAQALEGVSKRTMETLRTKQDLEATFEDPSWTKALFLRDPLDRLVSAYRSKCEPPMEGDGVSCMNFEDSTPKSWPSFDQVVSELHHCHNPHFDPQVSFCSLGAKFESYNFVGTITKDYPAVAADVQELVKQAAVRSGNPTKADLQALAELSNTYFPPTCPTNGNPNHFHTDTDVRAYYKDTTTLNAALQHYVVDYDRFSLKPPPWVPKKLLTLARHRALTALPADGEEDPKLACRLEV